MPEASNSCSVHVLSSLLTLTFPKYFSPESISGSALRHNPVIKLEPVYLVGRCSTILGLNLSLLVGGYVPGLWLSQMFLSFFFFSFLG